METFSCLSATLSSMNFNSDYVYASHCVHKCHIAFQLSLLYMTGGQGCICLIWFADCFCKTLKEIWHDVNSSVTSYYIMHSAEFIWIWLFILPGWKCGYLSQFDVKIWYPLWFANTISHRNSRIPLLYGLIYTKPYVNIYIWPYFTSIIVF